MSRYRKPAVNPRRRRPALCAAAWASGAGAASAMAALYVGVLLVTSGPAHLADQWTTYRWALLPLWALFGGQVALLVDMRRRSSRVLRSTDAAAAGTTAVGMLACCAHHAAELVPLVASVGIAGALVSWQPWILAGALLLSIAGTAATMRSWGRTHTRAEDTAAHMPTARQEQPCKL